MKIPVFHDDQHGTAIIVAAAVLNGLRYVGKSIENVKLAGSGAGAAMLACLDLLVSLGLRRENIVISDIKGVVYAGRKEGMDPDKERYARDTSARSLGDIMPRADVFLGLFRRRRGQAGDGQMAEKPLILALANPEPEIRPEAVKQVRSDALIFTGRSDYPNQVNNVLCFPFIFRGALDVGATTINEPMKIAAVHAIADLAHAEVSDVVASAYGGQGLRFGPEYLIPTPSTRASSSVSLRRSRRRLWTAGSQPGRSPILKATATASPGSCTAPARSCSQYSPRPQARARRSPTPKARTTGCCGPSRPPSTSACASHPRRAPGRNPRQDKVVGPANGSRARLRYRQPGRRRALMARATEDYYVLRHRRGLSHREAEAVTRRNATLFRALLLRSGEADGMLCGTVGTYADHLKHVSDVVGRREGVSALAAMHLLMLPRHTIFVCDTYINVDPSAEELTEFTLMAAEEVRRFGLPPRVALLSHSNFGTSDAPSARKMRDALRSSRSAPRSRDRWGDARGCGAVAHGPQSDHPRCAAERRCQPAHHAEPRCCQHHVQRPEGRVRRGRDRRSHPAWHRSAGAHPDANQHRAPHPQHDRADGRRRRRSAVKPSCAANPPTGS